MKTRYVIALSLLAGTALGAAAVQGLHAQAKPPVYYVAEIDVTDLDGWTKEYAPKAQALIKEMGGTCPCRRPERHLAGRRAAEEACRDPGLGQHGSDQSLAQLGEVQGTSVPSRQIRKSACVHG